jgi:5-methyltetrahydrofolate corrinoid/iron sulfur protein methyltransferase
MSERALDIIGENFNTTRRLKITSQRVVHDGRKVGIAYTGLDGGKRLFDITGIYPTDPAKLRTFQIPHVAHAVRCKDLDYIAWIINSQTAAGANIIDLCVDELTVDSDVRHQTMAWLVPVAQKITDAVIAIDSSDPETIMTGLGAHDGSRSRPAINSVNLEEGRQDLIKEAKSRNALLFANASGRDGMPRDEHERVNNLAELMQMMDQAGIAMTDRYLDPLAFPVTTGSAFGCHYLDAVREIRQRFPQAHIFGGHSNASFGLPQRKIANNAFIILSILAGCDTLMIDPVLNSPKDYTEFKIAADLVLGRDKDALRYMMAFRNSPSARAGRSAPRTGTR